MLSVVLEVILLAVAVVLWCDTKFLLAGASVLLFFFLPLAKGFTAVCTSVSCISHKYHPFVQEIIIGTIARTGLLKILECLLYLASRSYE